MLPLSVYNKILPVEITYDKDWMQEAGTAELTSSQILEFLRFVISPGSCDSQFWKELKRPKQSN